VTLIDYTSGPASTTDSSAEVDTEVSLVEELSS
jgi:hypothetical protein